MVIASVCLGPGVCWPMVGIIKPMAITKVINFFILIVLYILIRSVDYEIKGFRK